MVPVVGVWQVSRQHAIDACGFAWGGDRGLG